jgi:2-polyprenyl-3-methyl-5-hydroxy-6-metoxy-1,4-benzoquinol methylase
MSTQSVEELRGFENINCNFCGSSESQELCAYGGIKIVKCAQCAQAYRNPRLNIDAGKELYERNYYEQYKGIEACISSARTGLFTAILNRLDKEVYSSPKRLLDVGCGQGHFLKLANDRGWEVYGNDLSKSACNFAQREFGLDLKNSSLEEAGFTAEYFDVISLWNALDHLYNPFQVIQEARRLLKPKGILFIRVPNLTFHLFLYRLFHLLRFSSKQPFVFVNYSFDNNTLKNALIRSGLKDITIKNSPLTEGDPYKTFSLGKGIINLLKKLYLFFSIIIYYLSAKKIFIGPSLIAFASK